MRIVCLAALLPLVGLLVGCGLGTEEAFGMWDCDHAHWLSLTILPTRMILQTDTGTLTASGYWKDDTFWCPNASGGGDYEAAKVLPDDELTLQAKAFVPGSDETVMCYKTEPGAAEERHLAQENPGPVTYPPPKGAITVGMTEYKLNTLPWKPTQVSQDNDDNMPEVYQFPSNDPNKSPLTVSVQNHHVISVNGGNE
jgi:hypothetical protein